MSKRHITSQEGSELANKISKVEMKNISSTSEKGSEPPDKVSKVEIPKNP